MDARPLWPSVIQKEKLNGKNGICQRGNGVYTRLTSSSDQSTVRRKLNTWMSLILLSSWELHVCVHVIRTAELKRFRDSAVADQCASLNPQHHMYVTCVRQRNMTQLRAFPPHILQQSVCPEPNFKNTSPCWVLGSDRDWRSWLHCNAYKC